MTTVVVIEDEIQLRELIIDELEDAGYSVHAAGDGVEGLKVIRENTPDVVCCDVNMPRMNGLQMKVEIDGRRDQFGDPMFIYISAQVSKTDIEDATAIGADHYIKKPINYDFLMDLIEKGVSSRKN